MVLSKLTLYCVA